MFINYPVKGSFIYITVYVCFCSVIDFNEFLDLVIQHQGDAKDVYDEIMQGFKLLDVGESMVMFLSINCFL